MPWRPEFGLLLPHEEGPGLPSPTWTTIRDVAREAEDVGISSVWLVDHFLWRGDPWGREKALGVAPDQSYGVTECWTTLAAVAEATDTIRIGTMVTCTAYRNPAMLAKMADNVDAISGGRLILGIGAGDNPPEHLMLGVPTDRSFARFEEALAIIVPLLRTGRVDFVGEFYSAHEMELKPRGPRPNGPPIMIGSIAHGPRSLRLIAQYADIWNTWLVSISPEELPLLHEKIDAACLRHARDPRTLHRTLGVPIVLDGPKMKWPGIVYGSDAQIAERLSIIAGDRVDQIQLILFPTNPRTIQRVRHILELSTNP